MYSEFFNGWIGKLDDHWSQEERHSLFESLCTFYHKQITSGQKLFVAYDHHTSSKYLALEAAIFFAERGIPIFISNRPITTSMIQIITSERFGCGSLSFTRDDYPFPYVGLKASKINGSFLTKKDVENVGKLKNIKKQNIDWFDPIPNLKNYLEAKFELKDFHSSNDSTLWNAMYSPSSPILEELFKGLCDPKTIEAYTINSFETTLPRDMEEEMDFQEQVELTFSKVNDFFCQYGITTSPDLTSICMSKKQGIGSTYMSLEEKIERIYPLLLTKGDVLISNRVSFKGLTNSEISIVNINEEDFDDTIKEKDFAIAVDSELNIYLQNELFPNQFAVLFCLFHSTFFKGKKETQLIKELSATETI